MSELVKSIPGGEPICMSCRHCIRITKTTGRRYDLDCDANGNLGGVTYDFFHCCSYCRK